MYTTTHPTLSPILKQLIKKESKTRLKAVTQLLDLVTSGEGIDEVIRLYSFITTHVGLSSLGVRKIFFQVNKCLFDSHKKQMVPILQDILGIWLLNTFDVPIALEQLSIFPNLEKPLLFCQQSVTRDLLVYLGDKAWTGHAAHAISLCHKSCTIFADHLSLISDTLLLNHHPQHLILIETLQLPLPPLVPKLLKDTTSYNESRYWRLFQQCEWDPKTIAAFVNHLLRLPQILWDKAPLTTILEPYKDHLEHAIASQLQRDKDLVSQLYCHFYPINHILPKVNDHIKLSLIKASQCEITLEMVQTFQTPAMCLSMAPNHILPLDLLILKCHTCMPLLSESEALQVIPHLDIPIEQWSNVLVSQACVDMAMPYLRESDITVLVPLLQQYHIHQEEIPIHLQVPYYCLQDMPPFPLEVDAILELFALAPYLSNYFNKHESHVVEMVLLLLNDHDFLDDLTFLPTNILSKVATHCTIENVDKMLQCCQNANALIYKDTLDNMVTLYAYYLIDPMDAHSLNVELNPSFQFSVQDYTYHLEKWPIYQIAGPLTEIAPILTKSLDHFIVNRFSTPKGHHRVPFSIFFEYEAALQHIGDAQLARWLHTKVPFQNRLSLQINKRIQSIEKIDLFADHLHIDAVFAKCLLVEMQYTALVMERSDEVPHLLYAKYFDHSMAHWTSLLQGLITMPHAVQQLYKETLQLDVTTILPKSQGTLLKHLLLLFGNECRQYINQQSLQVQQQWQSKVKSLKMPIMDMVKEVQQRFIFDGFQLQVLSYSDVACRIHYEVDEMELSCEFVIPGSFPLVPIQVKMLQRVGVSEPLCNQWLLSTKLLLQKRNGQLYDGIQYLVKSIQSHFSGHAPCAICISIIGVIDKQLPNKTCRQCRQVFHSGCLRKWFKESQQSACPLCRTLWK